jgi:hypothetical protein
LFFQKLTDQLSPLMAAIDFSEKKKKRNIFSGAMFTLKCGHRRPVDAVGVFIEPNLLSKSFKGA